MNNRGMSFIHLLMFALLLSGMIVTSMTLTTRRRELSKMIQGEININKVHSEIHGILSNGSACLHTLGAFEHADSGPGDEVIQIKDLHENIQFEVGGKYGDKQQIEVVSMTLGGDIPAGGGDPYVAGESRLYITYRKGKTLIRKRINLTYSGNNPISDCSSIDDPNGDDINTSTCRALWFNAEDYDPLNTIPNMISSDCANVGVGTTTPQHRLDVNGNINVLTEFKIYRKNNPLINFGKNTDIHLTVIGPETGSSGWDRSLYMGINNAANIEGLFNVAIGVDALSNGTGGAGNSGANTIIGSFAGFNNENKGSTLVGYNAGLSLNGTGANGEYNTCIGANSCRDINVGSYNVMLGSNAGANVVDQKRNVFIGRNAGLNAGGDDNVFIGHNAGSFNTGGAGNICIAAQFTNNSRCTPNPNDGRYINIGHAIFADMNTRRVAIGTRTFSGQNGSLNIRGSIFNNGILLTSDERFKNQIKKIENFEKLRKLRPVNYVLKKDPTQRLQNGFIAQEVQRIIPELVSENDNGYLSMNYNGLLPFILEDIKAKKIKLEQKKEKIKELKARIARIKLIRRLEK